MGRPQFRSTILLLTLLTMSLLACCSCGKNGDAPQAVSLTEASSAVKSAFAAAPAELKQSADAAAQGIADGQYVSSFVQLDDLASRPELTPEQRESLAQSQVAVMLKLTEAAAQGDENAAKALEVHRARK
jgi:hypothetical protein